VGADHALLGSVLRNGDALRVIVRLVRTRDGAQVWSRQFDRPVAELLSLQDEIATLLVPAMQVTAPPPSTSASRPTGNAEAYLAYLHGRLLVGRFTVREAEAAALEFERAAKLDPSFAAARVALFDARMQAASLRRRPTAAALRDYLPLLEDAEQLDANSGAAWYARAMWVERESSAIDAAFRRAVALDARDSRGLTAYSEFLDDQGRDGEARAMLDVALRVDPLSARARFRQNQRRFKDVGAGVEQYALETLKLFPDFYPALQRYGKYRWMQHGDFAQAIAIVERAIAGDPENPWGPHTAAAFYVDIGDANAARAVVQGNATARASTRALLAVRQGDWRSAGEAALEPGSFVFNGAERWCIAPALRDLALRDARQRPAVIALLTDRYHLPAQEPWVLGTFNFREAELLAHLLLAEGLGAEAQRRLQEVIAWIDTHPQFGPVYNTRTKAQALMLLGRRDEALAVLAQSFAQFDYTFWWYTLERDPTWDPVRRDPRFLDIDRTVRAFVDEQRRALEQLRASGTVPRRAGGS
jgi:tetratricopeptide (TPR) repeat protein